MHVPVAQMDPLAIGQKLIVDWVLTGSFLRSGEGFDLNWQLLEVQSQSVRGGGSISVPSFDLITVQTEIVDEVFASLQGIGQIQPGTSHRQLLRATANWARSSPRNTCRPAPCSPDSCSAPARAPTSTERASALRRRHQTRSYLRARVERPRYRRAAVHPLWIRRPPHVMAARKALDRALELDPGSVEANLYRVYMLLSRGEKECARHGVEHLLRTAANDWNVHLVAGITLRVDGMYEEALAEFHRSLMLNPSGAAVIYNHRARVYQYQNQLELAEEELQKGLTLEPKYPLLRTSLAYQRMRQGDLASGHRHAGVGHPRRRLDAHRRPHPGHVLRADGRPPARRLADRRRNHRCRRSRQRDGLRLATYFAVDGDESEALHWLRRAIYLGNENYPWFSKNPAWNRLREHADFERILEDLKKSFRRNQKTWKRLLAESGA